MNAQPATAEVMDALASIEMQRKEREKESGVPASCSWALSKLHELLPRQGELPENFESTAFRANIAAANLAIGRLREFAQVTGQRATLRKDRPWHQQKSWRDAQKRSAGNRDRGR